MAEQKHEPKPFNYPDFKKCSPEVIKALEKRRPYSSSDFRISSRSYMIPDLRWTFGDKQYGD